MSQQDQKDQNKCRDCQERTLCAVCGQTQICFIVDNQCSTPKGRDLCLVCHCKRCDHPTMCVGNCERQACELIGEKCEIGVGTKCVTCRMEGI